MTSFHSQLSHPDATASEPQVTRQPYAQSCTTGWAVPCLPHVPANATPGSSRRSRAAHLLSFINHSANIRPPCRTMRHTSAWRKSSKDTSPTVDSRLQPAGSVGLTPKPRPYPLTSRGSSHKSTIIAPAALSPLPAPRSNARIRLLRRPPPSGAYHSAANPSRVAT